jgi:iron complex transport system ATP-binding protein
MITAKNLCKAYGSRTVLDNFTGSFPPGKVTALIGPNGAGKSTLLMLLARLLEPSAGELTLNGSAVSEIRTGDYARKVATLRQSPELSLRLSVEDLVSYGRFPYSRGRLTAADQRAIDAAISFLSLDNLRLTHIDELSGGQRQMAFLAMTIAQDTPCLLLDEPLNNLDMHHAVQIMNALRLLCDDMNKTVILVIHDINFAVNFSDHIVALKAGRLHSAGAVRDVITERNLCDLYDLRFEILSRPNGLLCDYFTSGQK